MVLRRFILSLLAGALASAMFVLGGCSRVGDTIRIGVAQPLSGPLGPQGQDMLNGVKMAVDELNKAGFKVEGRPVKLEVVSADDRADPEAGKVAAQTLVDAGVVVVIGDLNSGVSIAAAPIYAERHVPQLAISTKPQFTQLGLPTTFRLVANDTVQSKAMASYAAEQLAGSVYAVVDDNTSFGKSLGDTVTAQLKAQQKVVGVRMSLDDKTTAFASLVAEMQRAKVDVLVNTLADFQELALLEQMAKAGLKEVRVIGCDNMKTDKLVKGELPLRHVYATSPIIEAGEFSNGRDFLRRFRQATGGEPVYGAHYAYDAVHVVVAAIKRLGSTDGKKLTAELKRIDALAPVTNAIRFKPDGEQYYGAVSVYKALPGGWEAVMRSDQW